MRASWIECSSAERCGEYAPGDLNEPLMIDPVDVGDAPYEVSMAAGKRSIVAFPPRGSEG